MNTLSERLRRAIAEEEPRLRAISDQTTGTVPGRPGAWSGKEELGHLIDSATNNRVRIVKGALEGRYAGPGYDGVGWVEIGGYSAMEWRALIDLWKMLNEALAASIDRVPAELLSAECRIGDAPAVTLEFVIDDYILHM